MPPRDTKASCDLCPQLCCAFPWSDEIGRVQGGVAVDYRMLPGDKGPSHVFAMYRVLFLRAGNTKPRASHLILAIHITHLFIYVYEHLYIHIYPCSRSPICMNVLIHIRTRLCMYDLALMLYACVTKCARVNTAHALYRPYICASSTHVWPVPVGKGKGLTGHVHVFPEALRRVCPPSLPDPLGWRLRCPGVVCASFSVPRH